MTQQQHRAARASLDPVRAALTENPDWLKPLIQETLQQVLEAEMEECLGASKSERTQTRTGYRQPRSPDARCGTGKVRHAEAGGRLPVPDPGRPL